jgi:hypothetical protein
VGYREWKSKNNSADLLIDVQDLRGNNNKIFRSCEMSQTRSSNKDFVVDLNVLRLLVVHDVYIICLVEQDLQSTWFLFWVHDSNMFTIYGIYGSCHAITAAGRD